MICGYNCTEEGLLTEHSAEYNRIMRARRRREKQRRRRVGYILVGLFALIVLLGASMLVIRILTVNEHNKAVDIYNQNNWTTVEPNKDGYSVYGVSDGMSFSYTDNGTYYEGVLIEGVPIGGMTFAEARQVVVDIIEERLNDISISVSVGNASLALSANDFNVSVNAGEVLENAYQLGRESLNDYAANYRKQQEIKAAPVDFKLEFVCDRSSIMRRVDSIADFVNTDPVEPYISVASRPGANTSEGEGGSYLPVITDPGTTYDVVYADNGMEIGYIFYHPGRNGNVLNEDKLVDGIVKAFEDGDLNCVLTAELENTAPTMTVEDIKGSVSRISGYTSKFDAAKKNRSRNVQKGAGILNGCEVKPGQDMSFNDYIGPRTEALGWLPAPGIVNGTDLENSPGGGICQVSGTLYNALLQCGPNKIKITKRQHHSWPSDYVPYGLDATVDTNGPDLRWKNVSEDSLYIFSYADLTKGVMYVYVYSVPESDGSYYETWAETIETIEPGETVIIDNNSWPTGYQETTVKARKGYTAKAYLKHFDSEGELIETIYLYTDYYRPITGVITRGTGDPSLPKPKG